MPGLKNSSYTEIVKKYKIFILALFGILITSPSMAQTSLLDIYWQKALPEQIKAAIQAGSNLNTRDKDGYTPLMFAAAYTHYPAVIDVLLKAGAKVNDRDKDGWTPLMFAASNNATPEVMTILIQAGARVDDRERDGRTALMLAARYNKIPEVVILLLKSGADGKLKSNGGKTAFDYAGENENLKGSEVYWELNNIRYGDSTTTMIALKPIPETEPALLVPMLQKPATTIMQTTIARAEKGNAMETTLGGAQGMVGQGIYAPIYRSMPLPKELPQSIYSRIPAQVIPPNQVLYSAESRQKAFRNYYEISGSVWKLKALVPLDQREPLWGILEDAGYELEKADYKIGKNLSPVVVNFTVTKDRKLSNVELVQSSGDPLVDESILYVFRRASFWNKTGDVVSGKFTYRF